MRRFVLRCAAFPIHSEDSLRRQPTNEERSIPAGRRLNRRRGLTLTELMIAIAVTLVLLGVLIRMFSYASGEITKGRAVLEMSGQLRTTSELLRYDLSGLTCPTRPWTEGSDGLGYFEYLEGFPYRDDATALNTSIGDVDDVLMFTARSKGRPFRGRYWPPGGQPTIIESDLAEIIWWTVHKDENADGILDPGEQLMLHRRVLLIRPDLNDVTTGSVRLDNDFITYYERNDVSVRASVNGLAANSLSDLSRRENRFAHWIGYPAPITGAPAPWFPPVNNPVQYANDLANSFPHAINRAWLNQFVLSGNYEGEDVAMSSLIAFDVKVYDPTAPIYDDRLTSGSVPGHVALHPTDPGFGPALDVDFTSNDPVAGTINQPVGRGAFVDLGYEAVYASAPPFPWSPAPPPYYYPIAGLPLGAVNSNFSGPPVARSFLTQFVYSTWPTSYESDGINQDGDTFNNQPLLDEGTDGFDTDGINGTDDPGERETSPPYPFQIRGIQVIIRVLEADTTQSRQVTIVQNFVPE